MEAKVAKGLKCNQSGTESTEVHPSSESANNSLNEPIVEFTAVLCSLADQTLHRQEFRHELIFSRRSSRGCRRGQLQFRRSNVLV